MKGLFRSFFLISIFCVSCQHEGVILHETPMGLTEIRRVVTTVIGEPRKITPNGYELTSAYYDAKEKPLERPNEARERFYTVVNILGDRRPYDIQVRVFVEVRTPQGFENVGLDEAFAQSWAGRIRKALHESRDKRNFVDDFKVF